MTRSVSFSAACGAAAHKDVQVLAGKRIAECFLRLVLVQMGQQIGDGENRVAVALTDDDVHAGSVLFDDDAVQAERNRHPLILFDAAVVMRLHKGQLAVLVQRILFEIKTRGVDMRAGDHNTVR